MISPQIAAPYRALRAGLEKGGGGHSALNETRGGHISAILSWRCESFRWGAAAGFDVERCSGYYCEVERLMRASPIFFFLLFFFREHSVHVFARSVSDVVSGRCWFNCIVFPWSHGPKYKDFVTSPIGQNVPSAVSSQLISATDKQQYSFFLMVCKLQGKSILSDNMWL